MDCHPGFLTVLVAKSPRFLMRMKKGDSTGTALIGEVPKYFDSLTKKYQPAAIPAIRRRVIMINRRFPITDYYSVVKIAF